MQYEKAEATVVKFEREDVIVASGCDQPQFDAEHCDGSTQAVVKPF